MNDVTYLGVCFSLLCYLGGSLAGRYPNRGVLRSAVIFTISSLVFGLAVLTIS
jgi:hypothetical protein